MKQCSLDARSESQRGPPFRGGVWEKKGAIGPPLVLAQRAASEGWDREPPDRPSCSQNAHDKKDWKDTHVGPVLPERAP